MTDKKFGINLTPQNDEWIKLIPNPNQNMDFVINKLVSVCINDGTFLEIISQSLTLSDLSKFKLAYSKLQSKRAEHIADLDINSAQPERKKTPTVNVDSDGFNEITKSPQPIIKKDAKKQLGHGFAEDSF